MKKRNLGTTDLTVANICLGTVNFGLTMNEAQSFEILDAYATAGGNFIDTANVYCKWVPGLGNCGEVIIGRWLRARNAYNSMIVATKGAHPCVNGTEPRRLNKTAITEDLDESRRALGLETIDFYWLHRDDEEQPIEEIVDMMEHYVKAGDIRYYGASNFKLHRMEAAWEYANKHGLQGFSAVQNQWALAAPDPDAPKYGDPTMIINDDAFYNWHVKTKLPAVPYSATANGFFHKIHQLSPQNMKKPATAGFFSVLR